MKAFAPDSPFAGLHLAWPDLARRRQCYVVGRTATSRLGFRREALQFETDYSSQTDQPGSHQAQ